MNRTVGRLPKDPKFKVIPNLGLRGKDIMIRLRNRSLILDPNGQYSIDEEIEASRRMDKVEILNKMRENQEKIGSLTSKLNETPKSKKAN